MRLPGRFKLIGLVVMIVAVSVAGCWDWNTFSQNRTPDMANRNDGGACNFGDTFGTCTFAP